MNVSCLSDSFPLALSRDWLLSSSPSPSLVCSYARSPHSRACSLSRSLSLNCSISRACALPFFSPFFLFFSLQLTVFSSLFFSLSYFLILTTHAN